jgi:tripartite-type tricarboxylate transporter receptor subunit TctC
MKLPRRNFLRLVACAAALPTVSRITKAQSYPSRTVRIIVGFAPGGSADITTRLIGQWLSERLGQTFIIENRPGAGTNIAVQAVVNAPPDGYTLLSLTSSNAANVTLYENLPFDVQRDIVPIATFIRNALALAVNPSLPFRSIAEIIAFAKANPGKLSVASFGVGSTSHLAQELFCAMAGINVIHVPYRGDAPALTDAISGQVQATFSTVLASLEHIRAGKLRALGVTTATRWKTLPEVPTIGETVPGYEASTWNGIGAPKGTAGDIVDKLNREINAGLTDPKMATRILELGSVPMPLSPDEFGKLLADETEKWGRVIRAAKIKPE